MTGRKVNEERKKFQWKFNKALFRRPISKIPIWVLIKEQERNWRGTLLAVLTIGIISGMIIVAALYVTYNEKKIYYQRLTIDELLWVSKQNRDPLHFWHKDSFVYANPNGTWFRLDLRRGISVRTFADARRIARPMQLEVADLPMISGLWPNPMETAWLVQYNETRIDLQDSGFNYVVVLADNSRIYVNPLGEDEKPILAHCASWNQREYSLTVHTGDHLYITDDILQSPNRRGFKCSTCNLSSGWVYGYPGWIYRKYFKYGHFGGFRWASGSAANFLLVLATDQSQMERINIDVYEDSGTPLNGAQKSIIYQPFQTKLPSGPRVPKVSVILIDRHRSEIFNLSWDMLVQVIRPFVPLNSLGEKNSGFYLTRMQWFNETGFILRGVTEVQDCGFILYCSISAGPMRVTCEHIWYYCATQGWIDMCKRTDELDLVPTELNSVLTVLPFARGSSITYQLADLLIIPGQKSRIRWLTENLFHVQELLYADNRTVLFAGSTQAGSLHLFQYNRNRFSLLCLTCKEMNDSLFEGSLSHLYAQVFSVAPLEMNRNTMRRTPLNESARTLSQVRVSSNGLYFTAQWYTGYEPFGASAIKEAPTRQLINHLTKAVVNASEYETTEFVQAFRMDPDAGLALWYIEPGESTNGSAAQVYLIWHSHMLMVHRWNSHDDDQDHDHYPFTVRSSLAHLIRAPRSLDTPNTKSAKQHQAPTSTYRMKVKEKFLNATQSPLYLLHPSPPFGDRPVANVVLRLISFSTTKKAEHSITSKSVSGAASTTVSQSQMDWDSVGSGALVRFWFPPYLNERHLKSYPLVINVKPVLEQGFSTSDPLLDKLVLFLSGSLDVIVLQVLSWVGEANANSRSDGIAGELANYHSLLRALSENYHYIERNRTALIGSPGLPSHLAGLLLSSEKAVLNPSCGLLLAPVSQWGMHEFVEAVRIFGPQDEQNYYQYDLTKLAARYRNKELLIVHGSTDTNVPFVQTLKFLSALIEENVDVNLYPLYDKSELSTSDIRMKHALLAKLSSFLYDCLRRTPDQRNHFSTKRPSQDTKELVV